MTDFSELAIGLKRVEQLTEKAAEALRLYREAVDCPRDGVDLDQLKMDAEFLIGALSDLQLQVLGLKKEVMH
jgi:hypothetical protein